jgi:hypothetical protein
MKVTVKPMPISLKRMTFSGKLIPIYIGMVDGVSLYNSNANDDRWYHIQTQEAVSNDIQETLQSALRQYKKSIGEKMEIND